MNNDDLEGLIFTSMLIGASAGGTITAIFFALIWWANA